MPSSAEATATKADVRPGMAVPLVQEPSRGEGGARLVRSEKRQFRHWGKESRKDEGLYGVQSVQFNSTIEVLNEFIGKLRVDHAKEEKITQKYIDMMSTKTPSQQQIIRNLSGGNQQKVMIGRWLATNPEILILDEPTRGVDVGAKAEIYSIMNELVKQGMSIIMISSEMPEIINMSDRVYVMAEGVVKGCISHEEITQEKIMQLAAI